MQNVYKMTWAQVDQFPDTCVLCKTRKTCSNLPAYSTACIHLRSLNFRHGYEDGSESSVIGVITLFIYMIGCCIIP